MNMEMFQFNPTIRETNRYLNKTVDDLLKKHGNVSNEEFEKELVAVTGIGWKRVKDYKNHPKPGQRLKDNSLVVKYVRECQRKDTARKVRHAVFAAVVIGSVIFSVFRYATKPKSIEVFAVHEVPQPLPPNYDKLETKVFLQVRDLVLRLGPIKHSKVPLDKFICSKLPGVGLTNCSYSEARPSGLFQVTLLIDHDFIRKYAVMTLDPVEIASLKKQLGNRVDRTIASVESKPLTQRQFTVSDESVQIMSNPSGPGSRAMLNVSVSFSSL